MGLISIFDTRSEYDTQKPTVTRRIARVKHSQSGRNHALELHPVWRSPIRKLLIKSLPRISNNNKQKIKGKRKSAFWIAHTENVDMPCIMVTLCLYLSIRWNLKLYRCERRAKALLRSEFGRWIRICIVCLCTTVAVCFCFPEVGFSFLKLTICMYVRCMVVNVTQKLIGALFELFSLSG